MPNTHLGLFGLFVHWHSNLGWMTKGWYWTILRPIPSVSALHKRECGLPVTGNPLFQGLLSPDPPWVSNTVITGQRLGSVQFSHSVMSDSLWSHGLHAAGQASLSITNSWSSPKLMSNESVMPSNHFILCRPLLLLPSIFLSIKVFSNESVLRIRWPKYWSFSFNISPSKEHPGLISFRIDWLGLLAVQGTLKSLLQHHSSKASIRQHSAFFIV